VDYSVLSVIIYAAEVIMQKFKHFAQRTKIVCTIGPATSSTSAIERLIKAGMNVARLNLSHGTHSEHTTYVNTIRKLATRLAIPMAILMDVPGPKYRTGKVAGGSAILKQGARLVLTTRNVEGNKKLVPVNYPRLPQDVKPGDTVLVDDGVIQLRVLATGETEVDCKVVVGGTLTPGRGIVVPGMHSTGPFITKQVQKHLDFAVGQKPDYLALSFVTRPDDVEQARVLLHRKTSDIPIIAKIERGQAVVNFDSLLAVSDGIMVARGDLGVDTPIQKVPLVQKEIIKKCNQAGKPVITATQMLESMVNSARPTRAEVADVANAIFDGTDAIMLSAETSVGKYPVQSVSMMAQIAQETESQLPYERLLTERGTWLQPHTDEMIAYDACHTAHRLGAAAIVAFSESGSTVWRVSKYRPRTPILAITPSKIIHGRLLLCWGVQPIQISEPSTVDEVFAMGAKLSRESGLARSGDLVVITAGIPIGLSGSTNLLKVEMIS